MSDTAEDLVWQTIDPDDIWALDKLILSRKLYYNCGPVGLDVSRPGYYIIRPCVNMQGLGLGTQRVWLEKDTAHLPVGHFWCEWFEGRHLSIDYRNGKQSLAVEGHKSADTFTRWDHWVRVADRIALPKILKPFVEKYEWINCEFIGKRLIEVHFRHNEDFAGGITHFIPVWEGESFAEPPDGYTYRAYPDVHGRIGAFVK
jgi:hypothetical protein